MSTDPLPLLPNYGANDIIAWWRNKPISNAAFLEHVYRIADTLPARRYAINLCEDRYCFMVAFAAAIVSEQINLLPSDRALKTLQTVAENYPDSYRVTDAHIKPHITDSPNARTPPAPVIPASQIVAIVFTSGSTGEARPHPKHWRDLVTATCLAQQRFAIDKAMAIVATVPAQHMYGLETSILLPLITGASVHGGRPFFPEDIRAALTCVPSPRVLISTPAHLRICTEAALQWPELALIISATAPLSAVLARQTEAVFGAPVMEIYGCTEGGSLASRRTLEGDFWLPYDGMIFDVQSNTISGPQLPEPIPLNDIIELRSDGRFILLGRQGDLINIAGKRASLGDLNHKLNEIDGIKDGVFIAPDNDSDATLRLAALVVAPDLSEREILAALAERIDPVFLPRPLYKVDQLPRNETSKLPKTELRALLQRLRQNNFQIQRTIPADHPCLAGHFPGNPIVPGVVILEEVLEALSQWRRNCRVAAISVVKFIAPLRPEQLFTISLAASDSQQVKFECRSGKQSIARGQFKLVLKNGLTTVENEVANK